MTAAGTRVHAPSSAEPTSLLARPAGDAGASLSAEHPLVLAQSALGNTLVQRHLRGALLQRKMSVTAPGDEFEREADSVAARIMRMEEPGAIGAARGESIQRAPAAPMPDEEKKKPEPAAQAPAPPKPATPPPTPAKTEPPKTAAAQAIASAEPKKKEEPQLAREASGAGVPVVTPALEAGVSAARGSGESLPTATRSFLEPRFGRDFSGVRMHADSRAASLARQVDAEAFTTGRDVFFASGRYQPHTAQGRQLIAHELTHTIQQGAATDRVQRTNGGGGGGAPAPAGGGSAGTYSAPGVPGSGASQPLTGTEPNLDLQNPPAWFPLPGRKKAQGVLEFPTVNIPGFKPSSASGGAALWSLARGALVKTPNLTRADTQISVWRDEVALSADDATQGFKDELGKLLNPGVSNPPFPVPVAPNVTFVLKRASGGTTQYEGTPRNLASRLGFPDWNSGGQDKTFEVDHIRELQLADYPSPGGTSARGFWAEHPPNFWLLERDVNQGSGRDIQAAISGRVTMFRDRVREYYRLRAQAAQKPAPAATAITDMQAALGTADADLMDVPSTVASWKLEFLAHDARLSPGSVAPTEFWTEEQIRGGHHLRNLQASMVHVEPGHIRVFTSGGAAAGPPAGTPPTGAAPSPPSMGVAAVDFDANPGVALAARERSAFRPFTVTGKRLDPTATGPSWGQLDIDVARNQKFEFAPGGPPPVLDVKKSAVPGAGVVETSQVLALFGSLRYKGASPIELDMVEVDPGSGVRVHGRIRADAPVLREGIDFEVVGDDVRVYKQFTVEGIEVPAPFHIYGSSLTLSAGTQSGLMVAGQIDFGIDRVGVGTIGAAVGTREGFALDGEFNFTSSLFNPARVAIHFHDNRWSGEGDLGIPEGKVQAIRSAAIHVGYAEGRLDAHGTAQLTIPGIQSAALSLVYDEAQGITIGGDVELANNIPGIRGGRGHAEVHQAAEGGDWRLAVSGEAQPAIPGIDTTISFAYDDGALTIAGHAAYSRGIASGTVDIGATNRPLDAGGQPIPGGTPGNELRAYGGGSLTLQLAPWLQGTIGVHLLPNGELEITGSVGLPAAINLFEAKDYNRPIFHTPPIDIPIVGVAVAGARVGIFATLSGGLDLSAGIGPGQLRELGLTVTYNPDHEDQTHVVGGAGLHIPAHAGLRLFIRGGLGVGIPLVSATANLEVSGQLGVEGALDAEVHVDWTPGTGIVLDASAHLFAEPKFRFAIDGTVLVEAGIGWLSATLYERRWNLAALEYGSGLRLGMRFPFHYEEGRPFELSWDQVEYEVPEIEPRQVLTGLLEQIT